MRTPTLTDTSTTMMKIKTMTSKELTAPDPFNRARRGFGSQAAPFCSTMPCAFIDWLFGWLIFEGSPSTGRIPNFLSLCYVIGSARVSFSVMPACISSRMAIALRTSALQKLQYWCVLALCPKRLQTKQTPARARFRTTEPSSPACVCSCPATPRNRKRWREERFSLSLTDTVVFLWNHAPNTRSVRNPRRQSPSFFSRSVQTASFLSDLFCLVLFSFESEHFLSPSWKILWAAMQMAAMELKHHVYFRKKSHPLDIL